MEENNNENLQEVEEIVQEDSKETIETAQEDVSSDTQNMSFFKKFLKALKKGYLIIIILSIIGLLTSLLIANFVIKDDTMIKFSFRYTIDLNLKALKK